MITTGSHISAGIEHMGCYWVPVYNSNLTFLEGATEDLTDNPRERLYPIQKCGTAAQLYKFNVFALAVGFCISGSNNVREYQFIETDICLAIEQWAHCSVFVLKMCVIDCHVMYDYVYTTVKKVV